MRNYRLKDCEVLFRFSENGFPDKMIIFKDEYILFELSGYMDFNDFYWEMKRLGFNENEINILVSLFGVYMEYHFKKLMSEVNNFLGNNDNDDIPL